MAERAVARLLLAVDLDADPIAGVVGDVGEAGTPFAGWIELTQTIELGVDHARQMRGEGSAGGQEDRGSTPAGSGLLDDQGGAG